MAEVESDEAVDIPPELDEEFMDVIETECEFTEDGEVVCTGDDLELEEVVDYEEDEEEIDDLELAKQKEEEKKIWTIVYSKKPELIIDKDEYDRILIDLL